MSATISTASIIAMAVASIATTLVPIGLLIFWGIKKRLTALPLVLGFVSFLVSQVFTRIPILSALGNQSWFQGFVSSHFLLYAILIGGFTAGLFEESARLGGALLLKKNQTFKDAFSFGVGHAFCEVIILVGLGQFSNLCMALMINAGMAYTMQLPAETGQAIIATLTATPSYLYYVAVLERVFAVLYHVSATILIFWGVTHGKKLLCWAVAIGCHTLFNSAAVILNQYSIWLAELAMAVLSVALTVFVWRLRDSFPLEKFSNPNLPKV